MEKQTEPNLEDTSGKTGVQLVFAPHRCYGLYYSFVIHSFESLGGIICIERSDTSRNYNSVEKHQLGVKATKMTIKQK